MILSFTYKRRTYSLEANTITLDINGQSVKCCYPKEIKTEWALCFGAHHSPLFYADNQTPVIGNYRSERGRTIYSQVFIDTETKKLVMNLVLRSLSGRTLSENIRSYTLMEIASIRRADSVMLIK